MLAFVTLLSHTKNFWFRIGYIFASLGPIIVVILLIDAFRRLRGSGGADYSLSPR